MILNDLHFVSCWKQLSNKSFLDFEFHAAVKITDLRSKFKNKSERRMLSGELASKGTGECRTRIRGSASEAEHKSRVIYSRALSTWWTLLLRAVNDLSAWWSRRDFKIIIICGHTWLRTHKQQVKYLCTCLKKAWIKLVFFKGMHMKKTQILVFARWLNISGSLASS